MFCRNCGTEMNDNARFCPKCGNPRNEQQSQVHEVVEDNNIKFQVIPEFNVPYKFLTNAFRGIFYMLFIIIYFFRGFYYFLSVNPAVVITMIIGIILAYIAIKMIFGKLQYDDMEYNFYRTKIEYKDGFLNKEEKELKYKYIREVTMSQNVLERIFGIGTIRIFTNASSGNYNGRNHGSMNGRNGIYIHCVPDVKGQYSTIKQIIDEGTPEE